MICRTETTYIFDPVKECTAIESFKRALDKGGLTYKEDITTLTYSFKITDQFIGNVEGE